MDALSEALRSVRITGAVLVDAELTAPWGMESPRSSTVAPLLAPGTEHMLYYHLVIEGRATARVSDQGASRRADVSLEAGDIVVLPHGDAHAIWNGRVSRMVDARPFLERLLAGEPVLERGGGGGAPTRLICGYFGCERYAERLFLAGLPPLFHVNVRRDPSGSWLEAALRHLVGETGSGRAGRAALLAKLSEALFIETLRRYMDTLPPERVGWLAAARDETVGRAMAVIHRDPARAWSLAELARQAGASRTVLVERFNHFLGQPPLAYLARWRLQLAVRLLETTGRSVLQIATEVGYESEAAFSRAFRRELGVPPARYRRRHRDGQGATRSGLSEELAG